MTADRTDRGNSLNYWLALVAFVIFAATFTLYLQASHESERADEVRRRSFLLAEMLRQSSDDLTRMARTYVVTGNQNYRRAYEEILEVREGKRARLLNYQNIYWDLLLPGAEKAATERRPVPLIAMMREAGFTEEEFARLTRAKAESDVLTAREYAAMNLVGSSTRQADTNRERAIAMLYDAEYDAAKASIMAAIGDFYRLADARTLAAARQSATNAARMRLAIVLSGILLLTVLAAMRLRMSAVLGGRVEELHTRIARLGRGDFFTAIPVPRGREFSILGWLSETQASLATIAIQKQEAEDRIRHLAHFDLLTGLPNRALLQEQAEELLDKAKSEQRPLALMFLDLDRFKNINDAFGHSVGDDLLVMLAGRLRGQVRSRDTVARLGGDEFAILLLDTTARQAEPLARRILAAISEPFQLQNHELSVSASLGIAQYPAHGETLDVLLRHADTALYHVKREGRSGYRFYTGQMEACTIRQLSVANALRHALDEGQFRLVYQPQISIKDGTLVGAEALIRWTHPLLGEVSPVEFIPVAEDSGLIMQIGEWVLRTAAQQRRYWIHAGLPGFPVAVNLSGVQFHHPSLPGLVGKVLKETSLPADWLELELTESVAMRDPDAAVAIIDQLHTLGVRVAIDDFGTGYSSLSYLKRFKVFKLKIDRSFVRDICRDADDRAIVGAVTRLARSKGLRTIAEGVETIDQMEVLASHGCDEAQGYLISKPLAPDQFEAFVKTSKATLLA
ncbi:putative bifunctional diguanylate cyclase/phosphodiesterase [Cupriavidus numazuensis]|nr:EAL domain-containing protein [Cupriavidus numazuensis]